MHVHNIMKHTSNVDDMNFIFSWKIKGNVIIIVYLKDLL